MANGGDLYPLSVVNFPQHSGITITNGERYTYMHGGINTTRHMYMCMCKCRGGAFL